MRCFLIIFEPVIFTSAVNKSSQILSLPNRLLIFQGWEGHIKASPEPKKSYDKNITEDNLAFNLRV